MAEEDPHDLAQVRKFVELKVPARQHFSRLAMQVVLLRLRQLPTRRDATARLCAPPSQPASLPALLPEIIAALLQIIHFFMHRGVVLPQRPVVDAQGAIVVAHCFAAQLTPPLHDRFESDPPHKTPRVWYERKHARREVCADAAVAHRRGEHLERRDAEMLFREVDLRVHQHHLHSAPPPTSAASHSTTSSESSCALPLQRTRAHDVGHCSVDGRGSTREDPARAEPHAALNGDEACASIEWHEAISTRTKNFALAW